MDNSLLLIKNSQYDELQVNLENKVQLISNLLKTGKYVATATISVCHF